jgi:hypothetical protein
MSDRGGVTQDVLLRIRAQNQATADFRAITAAVDDLTGALDKQTAAAARGEVKEKELIATSAKLGKAITELKSIAALTETFKNFDKVLEGAQSSVDAVGARLTALQAAGAKAGESQDAFTARIKKTQDQLAAQEANLAKQQASYRALGEALRKAGVDTTDLNGAIARMGAVFEKAQAGVTQLGNATLNYSANLKAQTAEAEKAAAAQRSLAGATITATAAQKAAAAAYGRGMSGAMGTSMQGRNDALKEQREAADARLAAQRAGFGQFVQAEKAVNDRVAAQARAEREAADARAKSAREVAEGAAKFNEEAAKKRMAAVKAEVEANAKARSDAIGAERSAAVEADKVRAAANDKAKAREREASARFDAYNDQRLAKVRKTAAAEQAEEAPRLRTGTPEGGRRTDALGRVGRGEGQAIGALGLRPYELVNLGYQINDIVAGFISGQHAAQIFAQQGPQVVQIFGMAVLRWLPLVGAAAAAAAVSFGALSRAFREINTERGFTASIMANPNAVGYDPEQLTKQTKQIRDMGVAYADARKFVAQAIEGNIGQGRITQIGQLAQDIADVKKVEFGEASKAIIEGLDGTQASLMKVVDAYHLLSDPERKRANELFAQGKAQEAMNFTLDRASARMREAGKTAISPLTDTLRTLSKTWDDLLETLGKSEFAQAVVRGFNRVIDAARDTLEWLDKVILKLEDIRKKDADRVESMKTGIDPMTGLPAGGGSVVPPVNPAAGTVAYAPIPPAGSGGQFVPGSSPYHTDALKALAALLTEAAQKLPAGYRVEASNTQRDNATVAGTNRPSEHSVGRAIDVKIVDANGNPVPGFMGTPSALYQQLDAAMVDAAKKANAGSLAVGSTFPKPDAGHYSLGGSEAAQNAAKRGDATGTGPASTGAPDQQKTAADARIKTAREQRAVEEAITEQQKRQAELTKIASEEREKGGTKEQQDIQIALRMRQVDQQLLERRLQREADDRRLAIDQARHLNEIRAAGLKARDEAQAKGGGLLGFDQLEAARKRGEQEEANRLSRLDAEQDRLEALQRQIGQLDRGLNSKNATDLAKALAAVDEQYQAIYDRQKKTAEQATDATKAQVEAQKPLIDALKERAKAEATLDSYRKQASSAERTRATLESTYNKLAEDGVISIGEAQQKIKEGYEATAGSITEAADALEEFIATNKNLSPERVAEYTAEVKRLRAEVQYVDPYLKELRKTLVDSIADNATKAFDTVAEALGGVIAKTKTWKDVWISMKTAAGQFFAGIFKDLASYIIKAQIAKAMSAIMPGLGGLGGLFGETAGAGAAASGAAASTGMSSGWASILGGAAAVAHEGGVVGNDNFPTRRVPAHWFASAPRYHTGTVVGLAPNERAAILQTGEEVLTADNPRHAKNWVGGGAAPDINIRNVLVADPNLVPSHMGSAKGERVIMNVLTKNAATVRQLVR